MRHTKPYFALIAALVCVGNMGAQDYFDDIYYNPKKDKSVTATTTQTSKQNSYIADMADMDVDTYNRRGQYYVSEIDTIGNRVENGEDFVYTQQIQKYYNPTIVVENSNALEDVLTNAYGNVDIVINNNGYPVFAPYYGWNYPYYTSVWSPWYWSVNWGPIGWNIGWYDPWFTWGPSWTWAPGWSWGPAWRPGPGGPGWGPGPMATWNPHGNRTVGPRPGWSSTTRPQMPGGNMAGGNNRPGGNYGGGAPNGNNRPHAGIYGNSSRPTGVVNNNGIWQYNTSSSSGHRVSGTGVVNKQNPSTSTNTTTTHRSPSNVNKGNVNKGNVNSSNTPRNNNKSVGTTRTPSNVSSGSRSTGGSRSVGGGARSTGGRGGAGGGRHR